MSRSIGLAHVIRHTDGTSRGVWGSYVLCSAFQPIFEFRGGKLVISAFEGLIRPFREGESVPPGRFFKSIPAQDRLEVETLTRTIHLLNAGKFLDPAARLFVNFDPSVFTDTAIADRVLREMRLTLHEAGIDHHRIVCEVTEHKVASHEALMGFVAALRQNGFKIAVDDYGADDSDMNRIRELKPEIVKFDAAWIVKLMDSAPGYDLLRTMVSTFNDWGIETLFEGIEEHWQLELAEKCDVRMVQGFVLARPQIVPTEFSIFSQSQPPSRDIGLTFADGLPFDDDALALHVDEVARPERSPSEAPPLVAQPFGATRPVRAFGRKIATG